VVEERDKDGWEVVSVGMNAISLHKINGSWKITSISDTAAPVSGSGD